MSSINNAIFIHINIDKENINDRLLIDMKTNKNDEEFSTSYVYDVNAVTTPWQAYFGLGKFEFGLGKLDFGLGKLDFGLGKLDFGLGNPILDWQPDLGLATRSWTGNPILDLATQSWTKIPLIRIYQFKFVDSIITLNCTF